MVALKRVAFVALIVVSLVGYPILLLPYLVHHNLPNAGLVTSSGKIVPEQLPQYVRPYLRPSAELYYLVLKQASPVRTDQPYNQWIMVVVTDKLFQPGDLVEYYDPSTKFIVDWRDYPFGTSFEEFIIPAMIQKLSGIEAYLESIVYTSNGGTLLLLSTADYYAGPVIFPLLALVFLGRLNFWTIFLCAFGYALGQELYTNYALIHHNVVPTELQLFGFTSFIWAGAAILFLIYETRTTHGRNVSEKVFSVRSRTPEEHPQS